MNVVGLITEYNPFHNGHLYLTEQAKEKTDAQCIISVMSGNFLQRGEPALINKWARAEMAIAAGIDLVIELPTAYATRSAKDFALGAVGILEATGVVTHLCFGSESGYIDHLHGLTDLLIQEPEPLTQLIGEQLSKGVTLPKARVDALLAYYRQLGRPKTGEELATILASPNNILGLEYLLALKSLNSSIIPMTIGRLHVGYHETRIDTQRAIASATGIRQQLQSHDLKDSEISQVIPSSAYQILQQEIQAGRGPVFAHDLSLPLLAKLRTTNVQQVAETFGTMEGIENRVWEAAYEAGTYHELVSLVKSKRYTWTRIQRLLCHFLLGYTHKMAQDFDQHGGPQYLRVLAFSTKGRSLLNKLKKEAKLPVITHVAPWLHPTKDKLIREMLSLDIKATDLYGLLYANPDQRKGGRDYRQKPIYLEQLTY